VAQLEIAKLMPAEIKALGELYQPMELIDLAQSGSLASFLEGLIVEDYDGIVDQV
jgi:hypothetical protein